MPAYCQLVSSYLPSWYPLNSPSRSSVSRNSSEMIVAALV